MISFTGETLQSVQCGEAWQVCRFTPFFLDRFPSRPTRRCGSERDPVNIERIPALLGLVRRDLMGEVDFTVIHAPFPREKQRPTSSPLGFVDLMLDNLGDRVA